MKDVSRGAANTSEFQHGLQATLMEPMKRSLPQTITVSSLEVLAATDAEVVFNSILTIIESRVTQQPDTIVRSPSDDPYSSPLTVLVLFDMEQQAVRGWSHSRFPAIRYLRRRYNAAADPPVTDAIEVDVGGTAHPMPECAGEDDGDDGEEEDPNVDCWEGVDEEETNTLGDMEAFFELITAVIPLGKLSSNLEAQWRRAQTMHPLCSGVYSDKVFAMAVGRTSASAFFNRYLAHDIMALVGTEVAGVVVGLLLLLVLAGALWRFGAGPLGSYLDRASEYSISQKFIEVGKRVHFVRQLSASAMRNVKARLNRGSGASSSEGEGEAESGQGGGRESRARHSRHPSHDTAHRPPTRRHQRAVSISVATDTGLDADTPGVELTASPYVRDSATAADSDAESDSERSPSPPRRAEGGSNLGIGINKPRRRVTGRGTAMTPQA